MMGGSDRMRAVLIEVQASMRGKLRWKPPFPLLPIDHVEVPRQHIDVELSSAHQQGMKKFSQTVWKSVGFPVDQHPNPAVKIPAEDHDAVTSIDRCGAKGVKVGISVDEKRGALGAFHPPTIATGRE